MALLSFLSLILNIKQKDDYRGLKSRYSEQAEYILQLEGK
jgi:hypothetical protein